MKRIYYSSGFVVTGDRIAQVVLEYASALAKRETSDTIEIPILNPDGTVGVAQLLVGPSSQLMTVTDIDSDSDSDADVDDSATIDLLQRRIDGLLRPEGQPVADEDLSSSATANADTFSRLDPDGIRGV